MEKRTRYQNIILIILAVMTVAFGALLVFNRLQPGIQFMGGFLKQEITGQTTIYSGECEGKNVVIQVIPEADGTAVEFAVDQRHWSYVVFSWNGSAILDDDAKPLMVTDGTGEEIFRGFLTDGGFLLNEAGEFDTDNFGYHLSFGNADPWQNFKPSLLTVMKLATEPELVCRGSIGLFAIMVIATLCVAVDILVPEFWFQLQHIMSVRDPEPSDFYIATQRIGWAVWPVLLAVGYGFAATLLP